jgi:hypothetical protein
MKTLIYEGSFKMIRDLQKALKEAWHEEEIAKGIPFPSLIEKVADILFADYSLVERRLFIAGCASPEVREVYEGNNDCFAEYWLCNSTTS